MPERPSSRPTTKLPHIPPTHRISKRPPPRPPIPSPYAGRTAPKVLYIKASTPFLSAVKRTQKLLAQIEKRDRARLGGPSDVEILARGHVGAGAMKGRMPLRGESASKRGLPSRGSLARDTARRVQGEVPERTTLEAREVVFFKATGKAIQRALELGLWFQQRPAYRVRVRTGEVGVIDDIVLRDDEEAEVGAEDGDEEVEGQEDVSMEDARVEENVDVPEARKRKVSMVEVAVGWR